MQENLSQDTDHCVLARPHAYQWPQHRAWQLWLGCGHYVGTPLRNSLVQPDLIIPTLMEGSTGLISLMKFWLRKVASSVSLS